MIIFIIIPPPHLDRRELAGGARRHIGELSALADMAANEIVPLAAKFERAKQKSKKFKTHLTCVLCHAKKRSIIVLPCAHLATCKRCSADVGDGCPICGQQVTKLQHIFIE